MSIAIYGAELFNDHHCCLGVGGIIWPLFFIWIYLFPNGQAVPRHILWVFGPLVVMFVTLFLMNVATIFMADSTTSGTDCIRTSTHRRIFDISFIAAGDWCADLSLLPHFQNRGERTNKMVSLWPVDSVHTTHFTGVHIRLPG